MRERELSLLLELLHQPTAPFRERRVVEFVIAALRDHDVPFFLDPIGNVIVGCDSREAYVRLVRARTADPLRLFVAHMDHPGFHGMRWLGRDRLRVQWHGGAPVRFLNRARVWVADHDGRLHDGFLQSVHLTRSGRTIETADVRIVKPGSIARHSPAALYGGFRFRAPAWRSGQRLYARVADDLVGVFAVLITAINAFRGGRKKRAPFLGLLTRAEEVGFIGAIGHFALGWLEHARRSVVGISLETSRTLPNAVIGKGPVVRLGDRRTVFDPGALNVLTQLAHRLLPQRHQRRVMDGGTCEATAATAYGLTAVGISVPLGNYHNQGFEGGPDCHRKNGPAPEFVHLDDVDGLVTLCRGLLRTNLPWNKPWEAEKQQSERRFRNYRKLL